MNAERFRRIDEIFNHARSLDADDRTAYLSAACGGDVELRAEVEALLGHDDQPDAIFRTPALKAGLQFSSLGGGKRPSPDAEAAALPESIGGYRIERVIGEGGFGIVYLALQENPRRTVALKVIRTSIATPQMLRRFEYEAQILGRLTHPGIAQIYEAGTDGDGRAVRAFFAMEYIRGTRLDQYIRDHGDDIHARLELIARVCDAVQYAHQKGVIHRDLKPANILVDEHGHPKILDFGVSRATDADIYTTTLHTSAGQLIGTLPYMSPEQVSGDPTEVDTRSDVYAIGVILYQLLTGKLPHDLSSRSIPEAARVIRDEQPTRLSSYSRAYRGDVDTIVLKAMEKDKVHRYQSAADLASDIRRYLRGEPIEAKRSSGWYVLQKTLRRYKFATAMFGAFIVVLIGASVALSVLYQRAESNAALAQHERDTARQEARRATVIKNFILRMMQLADARSDRGRERTVRDVLDSVAENVGSAFKDDARIEAELRETVCQTYNSYGLYEEAEPHLLRALEIRREMKDALPVEYADTLHHYAVHISRKGLLEESVPHFREALEIHKTHLGPHHVKYGWDLQDLGLILMRLGQIEGVEDMLMQAVDIYRAAPPSNDIAGREDSELVHCITSLGMMFHSLGKYEQAEHYTREAMALCKEIVGEDHPIMATQLNNLAAILKAQGKTDDTIPLYERSLALAKKTMGEHHPDICFALTNLGLAHIDAGRPADGERYYREALALAETSLPQGHPMFASVLTGLGRSLVEQQRGADAEPHLREALTIRKATSRPGDYLIGYTGSVLGACLVDLGHHDEAEPLLLESYEIIVESKSPAVPAARATARSLAKLYAARGDTAKAGEWHARIDPTE